MAKRLRAPRLARGPAPKPTALASFPGFPETSASFGTQPFSLCPFLIFLPLLPGGKHPAWVYLTPSRSASHAWRDPTSHPCNRTVQAGGRAAG